MNERFEKAMRMLEYARTAKGVYTNMKDVQKMASIVTETIDEGTDMTECATNLLIHDEMEVRHFRMIKGYAVKLGKKEATKAALKAMAHIQAKRAAK